jgi:hypothetical protein
MFLWLALTILAIGTHAVGLFGSGPLGVDFIKADGVPLLCVILVIRLVIFQIVFCFTLDMEYEKEQEKDEVELEYV